MPVLVSGMFRSMPSLSIITASGFLNLPLNDPFEWPQTVHRIVTLLENFVKCGLRNVERHALFRQHRLKLLDLQRDDLRNFAFAQGMEHYRFVDTVQKFRQEIAPVATVFFVK